MRFLTHFFTPINPIWVGDLRTVSVGRWETYTDWTKKGIFSPLAFAFDEFSSNIAQFEITNIRPKF